MFDVREMLQQELLFCELFTNKTVTDYGILYHNTRNPKSHDSNHALILNIGNNIDKVIRQIKEFYEDRGLTPRIYPSFVNNELEILRPYLESMGFKITVHPSVYMLYPRESILNIESMTAIRRISEITDDIVELVDSEGDVDVGVKVLTAHINDNRFHLLGLFQSGKCISRASVKLMNGYSRVDDVLTHPDYRRRHYGTELMKYLTGYHQAISNNQLYRWATNPIAIKLYQNIGFHVVDIGRPSWSAHFEQATSD